MVQLEFAARVRRMGLNSAQLLVLHSAGEHSSMVHCLQTIPLQSRYTRSDALPMTYSLVELLLALQPVYFTTLRRPEPYER